MRLLWLVNIYFYMSCFYNNNPNFSLDSAYNTISYTFQTFADKMMGVASFIMPLLVATSALGSLSCHIMTSSRLCFVGARQGHFPDCLSLITIDKNLPKPSLIFLVSLYCQYYMYFNYTLRL